MTGSFFIKLFFIVTLLMFFTFYFLTFQFYKVPQTNLWIQNCFIKKDLYANSIKTNKVVFTSGSNTLYGMETNILESELKIPVVNMAIHAGLKTDYILHRAKKVLKKGDIVIVPFEYQNLTWDGEQSSTRSDYILTHDKQFFINNLSFFDQIFMIYSISPLDTLKSIKEQLVTPNEAEIGLGYNSNTLNKNGDETFKKGVQDKILNTKYKPFVFDVFIETKSLKEIKIFSDWCKNNDIVFFMAFPNTINHIEYYHEPYTSYFKKLIDYFHHNRINMIGKPTDGLYPIEYFYDTNYHMNSKGAKIRTTDFMNFLKQNIDEHLQNLREQIEFYDLNKSLKSME